MLYSLWKYLLIALYHLLKINLKNASQMSMASHSGKAINISKTTVPHNILSFDFYLT